MLLKVKTRDDGSEILHNMHVPEFPEMSLFLTDIVFPTEGKNNGQILGTYRPPGVDDNADPRVKNLAIPLQPGVRGLGELGVIMHGSPTKGYNMGSEYNDWFSECFGYRVVLAYLGPHWRPVLGSFAPLGLVSDVGDQVIEGVVESLEKARRQRDLQKELVGMMNKNRSP